METTAVSIGKAVLAGALGYAKSVVTEEVALQLGIEGDVAFIGDELEMMQSFLMMADEEHDKHKVLITWVKQVREVAYNVEDSLMDFALLSKKKLFCGCIPCNLWEWRSIGMEVKELRAKVEDVTNRNLRYRLIKSSSSKPTSNAEEQANVASATMFGINEARRATTEREKSKVNLQQLVMSDEEDLRVIAVWGTHGELGKTSAIMEVYDHQEVNEVFGCRAWVELMQPFDPIEFLRSLVKQFYENSSELIGEAQQPTTVGANALMKMQNMRLSNLIPVFNTKVSDNRYLIVIDGLSTITEWDCVKKYFPNNKRRSRIIVSTQEIEIGSLCVEKPHQLSLIKQLSSEQTLYVFHKKVTSKPKTVNGIGKNSTTPKSEIMEDAGAESVFTVAKKFDRSKTITLADEAPTGRKREISEVIDLIDHDMNVCKVISIWGMGGVGKTTLVRSIYRSQQLGGWKRAWVTALHPLNPEMLIRSIVLQLEQDIKDDFMLPNGAQEEKKSVMEMGLHELIKKIDELVKLSNCLIVIDDLSTIEEWNSIKENLEKATRIIVTTREKVVAKHCSGKYVYSLDRLEEADALSLFIQKVFYKESTEETALLCDQDMIEQANHILRKCDGLPLAISTIGGFLATKQKTTAEWRKMNQHISVELENNPGLRTIKTVLMRSYDGLPYHLKSCILYMSVFQEEHKISRTRVVRRWIAEGYSNEIHNMISEEVGDKYFDELLDRSMILQGEDFNKFSWKVSSCQLHDMIREISVSKAREENLVFTLEEGCNLSSAQGTIRHLTICSGWKREKEVFNTILDVSHVRSLTVFGQWKSFFISKKMRFLRVLDLEGTYELENHHLDQVGELIHLKYLSIRKCGNITYLPSSVGKLRNLQTLDTRDTKLQELPTNITNLQKLQFLCTPHVKVPRGIGKLNVLCTLASVRVPEEGSDIVKVFAQLYHLRKLGINRITKTNSEEFWSAIANLSHLQYLSINWDCLSKGLLDYSLGEISPPKGIESLKLSGELVRLPQWIHQLQNLKRLMLRFTNLNQGAISAIGKLPNLSVLHVGWESYAGWKSEAREREMKIQFGQGSFPSLILLELYDFFSYVEFQDGTMPKLELLRIGSADEQPELSGLCFLTKLKEIRLDFKNSEDLMNNVQQQLAEHCNNVSIKPLG